MTPFSVVFVNADREAVFARQLPDGSEEIITPEALVGELTTEQHHALALATVQAGGCEIEYMEVYVACSPEERLGFDRLLAAVGELDRRMAA